MSSSPRRPPFPSAKTITYTNWGRSALEAAFSDDGCETVLVPAFLCQSLKRVFWRLDVTPEFVDIDPETYHIDPERARDRAELADAVLLVHSFGLPAQMDVWTELCADRDLTLIEDCARALGAEYGGDVVGSFGSYAIYSLSKVSPVSIGGAVAADAELRRGCLDGADYDTRALFHSLPTHLREDLSLTYPSEYDCRHLDAITRNEFRSFLRNRYEPRCDRNRAVATRLRDRLEPLGFSVSGRGRWRRTTFRGLSRPSNGSSGRTRSRPGPDGYAPRIVCNYTAPVGRVWRSPTQHGTRR